MEVGIISRFGKPFYQDNGLHAPRPVLEQQRPAEQEKGIKVPFGLPAEGVQITPLQVQGQSVGAVAVHPALLRAASQAGKGMAPHQLSQQAVMAFQRPEAAISRRLAAVEASCCSPIWGKVSRMMPGAVRLKICRACRYLAIMVRMV